MKALQLSACWDPRDEHGSDAHHCSKVWRHPRLEFIDSPIPVPGPDQVLVRVKSCGVCGSDAHLVQEDADGYSLFSGSAALPTVIGHEFAGEVVELGSQVTTLDIGDLVASESIMWCGVCPTCREGNVNQCQKVRMIGFSAPGAFAEFIAVSERYLWGLNSLKAISPSLDAVCDLGALIEPLGCAYNGIFVDGGGITPGDTVAVYGAGPIGLGAVMLARLAGASKVIAFDLSDERCQLALKLGADFAWNPDSVGASPSEMVLCQTDGQGADLQIEAAGAASKTIPQMMQAFAANGRMVYLGRQDSVSQVDFNPLVSRANRIVGARGHAGHGTFGRIIRLLASQHLSPLEMITSFFTFEQAIQAIDKAMCRKDGKVMVRVG